MKTIATIVALCPLLAACASSPTRPSLDADLKAITEVNARYLGSINQGDMATLGSLTTIGHVMLAPNRPPIVGKVANDAMNSGAFQQFNFEESWMPVETVVSGDLAFQRGSYVSIAKPKAGGEARTIKGSFLRIYQRQPDGQWRMTRDVFNSEP